MKNCPFCKISIRENVLFSTKHFVFLLAKTQITPHHYLLISKRHIKSEVDLTTNSWVDYLQASKMAWEKMTELTKREPLIFINPSQMQSVGHFHKHYVDGIFGVHGVANALQEYLK